MANSTFDQMKSLSTSESNTNIEKESPPPYVTFRKRLNQSTISDEPNRLHSNNAFETTVIDILSDIQNQQKQQFKLLTKDIEEIKAQNIEIKKSQTELYKITQHLSSGFDDLKARTESLERKLENHEKSLIKTSTDNTIQVNDLENTVENLQRQLRAKSLEVRNIDYEKEENLPNLIKNLFTVVGQENNYTKIVDVYRLPSKDPYKKSIVVEMPSESLKLELLKAVKIYNVKNINEPLSTKTLNKQGSTKTIYVSNYLTPLAAKLFYQGRELKRKYNYKFCWIRHGKVYIKKNDISPAVLLKSEEQLDHLKSQ